jgi:fructose-1,6-bisphosphatase II
MKEINLELVRVTEAAARAASAWVGSGDKESADRAATDAMRERLDQMDFAARIAIGEGLKDKSAGLFGGELVGKRKGDREITRYELAVDPIEGTRPVANSGPEATSVIAVAGPGCLFSTGAFYMNKLAWGPEIARKIQLDIADPLDKTVKVVSAVTGKKVSNIVVCVLDRPRHEKVIAELRRIGARIKLIQDCDVSGAIAACLPDSGIDLLYGIGGAPEAVIAACAIKCLRGGFLAQIVKKDTMEVEPRVYALEDLVKGPCAFAATGITSGSLLKGVRYTSRGAVTHSVFMRYESGTVRWLTAYHGN